MLANLRFLPYRYAWVEENGAKHEYWLISIERNGITLKMTDYNKYVGVAKTKYAYHSDNDAVRRVCNFLTYTLFMNREKYKAVRVTDIPFSAAVDYIEQYSQTKNEKGQCPGRQSVEKERAAVSHFMYNLGARRTDYQEHYYVKKMLLQESTKKPFAARSERQRFWWDYEIKTRFFSVRKNNLIRDMPQKAIPILLRAIRREEPSLLFAVLLQLCAGLREGELVNVRRSNSIYPGGIRYTKENGRFTSFEVDLTTEYALRSDGKFIGNIKVERVQAVYPIFLDAIQDAYEQHMQLIGADEFEEEAPMFVNDRCSSVTGKRMAISVSSYCNRIKRVMLKTVIPELLKADDSELKIFGLILNEGKWGLHAFRHWFSVQLVLNGEDLNGVAFWRGDKAPESAYTYLQNKGELEKRYRRANEIVANEIRDCIWGGDFNVHH